ncbi:hypothetical protein [Variovorax sp. LT1R16]|uniref:hypothetical protein n=1 Tax=Variovorax sp. LT1R16 TaxID=3443728 RepID=UPI003F49A40D
MQGRWFVGYLLRSEPMPKSRAFVQEMNVARAHPHVVGIVFRRLANSALFHGESEEFRINHDLLRTLRAQHLDT